MSNPQTASDKIPSAPQFDVTPEMIEAGACFAAESGKFPDHWEKNEPVLREFVADLLATCLSRREATSEGHPDRLEVSETLEFDPRSLAILNPHSMRCLLGFPDW